ncbi:MAG: winged helix-turn-helix transcriptional regulator [Phycisphaeraceae bacterium]|nr:winged helix-turn-helix transcriptional regulator [Phycisphaeraceae bacterium]
MAGDGTIGVFGDDRALIRAAERLAHLASHLRGGARAELLVRLMLHSAPQSELAREVGLDESRMSRLLSELAQDGLLVRHGVGRCRLVELGPRVRAEVHPDRLAFELDDPSGVAICARVPAVGTAGVSTLNGLLRGHAASRR